MSTMHEPASEDKPKAIHPGEPAPTPAKSGGGEPEAELTPDEQMAAFEKAMKEEDWGHQPC